jgi:hypothetical protein
VQSVCFELRKANESRSGDETDLVFGRLIAVTHKVSGDAYEVLTPIDSIRGRVEAEIDVDRWRLCAVGLFRAEEGE